MFSFLDAFFPPFKRHLGYAKLLKCLPYEWSEEKEEIISNETILSRVVLTIWKVHAGTYIGLQFLHVAYGGHTLGDQFVAVLILTLYIICYVMGLEFGLNSRQTDLLNKLLSKEGKPLHFLVGTL